MIDQKKSIVRLPGYCFRLANMNSCTSYFEIADIEVNPFPLSIKVIGQAYYTTVVTLEISLYSSPKK
jgi:hypothetical protein